MSSDSVKNFSDQVVDDPSSLLFGSLADFYRENGLYQEAINICLTGLESHPDNIEGRLVLAQCYKGINDTEKARTELTKILSVRPENSLAKKVLAELDKPGESEPPETAVTRTEEAPIPPEKIEIEIPVIEEPRAPENISEAANPAEPALADPADFHKGAQAMMALAAEATEKPKMEFVPPEPAVEIGPEETSVEAAPDKTAKPPAEADPKTMNAYGRILNEIIQTPQVFASLLVDESGYPVASAFAPQSAGVDEESSGALSSLVFSTATQVMQKVKLGELERVVIDTRNEKIFLNRVGGQVLMVTAESSAKTGLVAVNVKRAIERIKNL
ncbi:MAG: tetratricopeptide repeat protein [Candidatus Edwardsbacteria bacterium]|nr:tetratricopeptide repeat protein [Candidatus Edwardsbacteria bacterium]MBU1576684.1 tetratricopeptide repeat protein [Candidatus Edwardsbacteria bacterium]